MASAAGEDPYVQSNGVLNNRLGITDAATLQRVEYEASAVRLAQLRVEPVEGKFDLAHLNKIHERALGDVYDWAGQPRSVNISKGSSYFANPAFLEGEGKRLSREFAAEAPQLKAMPQEKVAERLAYYMSEWNALHPYREGNGRATRAFVDQMASKAGYTLDQTRIDNSKGEWNQASAQAHQGNTKPMEEIFRQALRPQRSVAFEQLGELHAKGRHPELAGAYQTQRAFEKAVQERFSGQPAKAEMALERGSAAITRELDAGRIVQPSAQQREMLQAPARERERDQGASLSR